LGPNWAQIGPKLSPSWPKLASEVPLGPSEVVWVALGCPWPGQSGPGWSLALGRGRHTSEASETPYPFFV